MSFRNLSPQIMFEGLSAEHAPQLSFSGESEENFKKWKEEAFPRIMGILGKFPEKVPLKPRLLDEWEHDSLLKQKHLINVQK